MRDSDLATARNAAAVGRLVTVPQTEINTTTGTATSATLKTVQVIDKNAESWQSPVECT